MRISAQSELDLAEDDRRRWLFARAAGLAATHRRSTARQRQWAGGSVVSLDAEQVVGDGDTATLADLLADPELGPAARVAGRALLVAVAEAAGRLAAADRELLGAAAGLNQVELARRLGVSRGALLRRLQIVRRRLWELLPADLREELKPLLQGRAGSRAGR